MGLTREFWYFVRHHRAWWIVQAVITAIVVAAIWIVGGTR